MTWARFLMWSRQPPMLIIMKYIFNWFICGKELFKGWKQISAFNRYVVKDKRVVHQTIWNAYEMMLTISCLKATLIRYVKVPYWPIAISKYYHFPHKYLCLSFGNQRCDICLKKWKCLYFSSKYNLWILALLHSSTFYSNHPVHIWLHIALHFLPSVVSLHPWIVLLLLKSCSRLLPLIANLKLTFSKSKSAISILTTIMS